MDSSHAAGPAAGQVGQAGPVLGTGGPRSEGTRRAILGAARATFAARGYEQTTIRAVAAQATMKPASARYGIGSLLTRSGLLVAICVLPQNANGCWHKTMRRSQ